jgi:hypothetical protein
MSIQTYKLCIFALLFLATLGVFLMARHEGTLFGWLHMIPALFADFAVAYSEVSQ